MHNASSNDPNQDFLDLFEFSVDFVDPANSTFTGPFNIAITEIDSVGHSAAASAAATGDRTAVDLSRHRVGTRMTPRG